MPRHKRIRSQSATHLKDDDDDENSNENNHPAPPDKRARRTLRSKEKSLVERTNTLTLARFSEKYYWPFQTEIESIRSIQSSSMKLHLSLTTWMEMPSSLREACISLVETTSRMHYHASEMGWSRAKKRKEMQHPAMKYLLLVPPCRDLRPGVLGGGEGEVNRVERGKDEGARIVDQIEGFLSFMITEEDGCEVVYCYELHLRPGLQGMGLGRKMVELMEMIGGRVGVEKAMLTVFRSNETALKAYSHWGYDVDEFSPEARKLRDGTVKEPTYIILSKGREKFARQSVEQMSAHGLPQSSSSNDMYSEDQSHDKAHSSK